MQIEILLLTGAGVEPLIGQGSAAPFPDTTYRRLVGRPRLNDAGDVLFRALLAGAARGESLLTRGGATGEVKEISRVGGSLPSDGVVRRLRDAHLGPDGMVLAHLDVRGDPAMRFGLLRFTDPPARALVSSDLPPLDAFTPPSRYARFDPFFATSADGAQSALVARVRDGAAPRSKTAVLRCDH